MKININENTKIKIEKICSQFLKETDENLSTDDCLRLSVEALWEEMDSIGVGRMFLRKHLWDKNRIVLNGRDKIIVSQ